NITMCRSNFRIKLDLCKFYNDVRRFSWIFIDSTKMFQIIHVIEHIVKLFNINEPFHLLLNEVEYLPPNEDIRILKENETVLVSPGSGLKNQFDLAVSTTVLPENQSGEKSRNIPVKLEQTRNSYQHNQLQTSLSSTLSSTVPRIVSCSIKQITSNPVEQTISDSVERIISSPIEQKISTPVTQAVSTAVSPVVSTPIQQRVSSPVEQKVPTSFQQTESMSVQLSSDSTTKSQGENFSVRPKRRRYRRAQKISTPVTQAVSTAVPPVVSTPIQQRVSSPVEQKVPTSFQQTESMSVQLSSDSTTKSQGENFSVRPKRRRYRRAKKKIQTEYSEIKKNKNNLKKPMIINYCTIPCGKHIRFDNIDDKNITEKDTTSVETMNSANTTNVSPPHELANLLSLGQNSTPLTFTNIRAKDEIKVEPISDVEISSNQSSENIKKDTTLINEVNLLKEAWDTDYGVYPIMTTKPQLEDVIAFQIFKTGMYYESGLSKFIVAKVISYCAETSLYTLKISQGLSEIQEPNGELTLTTGEEECVINDTIKLNYTRMFEPRLVSTDTLNKTINPVNSIDY
ncbi:hypothetical protein WN48_04567, partial [Eufriesea mexicana]